MKTDVTEKAKIYVACLAAYNNGYLHGRWIPLTNDPDELNEAIQDMLKASPCEGAEEWEIHDYDCYGIKNIDSLRISDLCELAEFLENHSDKVEVAAELYNDYGLSHAESMLEDQYIGCYESAKDFIYQYVEDTCMLEGVAENIKRYFDYDSLLHDMECNSEIISVVVKYDEHHYFWNH